MNSVSNVQFKRSVWITCVIYYCSVSVGVFSIRKPVFLFQNEFILKQVSCCNFYERYLFWCRLRATKLTKHRVPINIAKEYFPTYHKSAFSGEGCSGCVELALSDIAQVSGAASPANFSSAPSNTVLLHFTRVFCNASYYMSPSLAICFLLFKRYFVTVFSGVNSQCFFNALF